MHALLQAAHSVSPLAAGVLIASIWQGLLLTAGIAIALRLLRSVSPASRASLWSAVLVLVLLLPVLAAFAPHRAGGGGAELHVAENWSFALLALWAVFSFARAVRLGAGAFRLWRLTGRATPVEASAPVNALLRSGRLAQMCVSAEVDRPCVTGLWRPRVLLPTGLMESLSPAELEHVVLHEMEHLRRYDDWLNLLQQVSLVLLPLNPALFWLDRRLCRERELACDDGVLEATQARKAYAACLVKLAEDSLLRKGVALALSALGTRARESELVGRVRRILAGPERAAGAGRGMLAVGALSIATVAGVGAMLRSPELVRFDGMPEMAARIAPIAGPVASRTDEAILTRTATTDVRPVLAKAVLEGSGSRRVAPLSGARKKVRVRSLRVRAAAESAQWMTVPAAHTFGVPTHHVVMTEYEVSQPVYAAVPYGDGWLIVQL